MKVSLVSSVSGSEKKIGQSAPDSATMQPGTMRSAAGEALVLQGRVGCNWSKRRGVQVQLLLLYVEQR